MNINLNLDNLSAGEKVLLSVHSNLGFCLNEDMGFVEYLTEAETPVEMFTAHDIDEEIWQGYAIRPLSGKTRRNRRTHTILVNIDEEYAPDEGWRDLNPEAIPEAMPLSLPKIAPYGRYRITFRIEDFRKVEWELGKLMWFGALGDVIVVEA